MEQTADLFSFGIYAAIAFAICGIMIGLAYVLGENHKARFMNEPFESGMPLTGSARFKFSAHYYVIAMFFVIFDLDAVFVITYAIAYKELGWPGYIGVSTFIAMLFAVLVYEWRIGALNFAPNGKEILKHKPEF